MLEYLEGLGPSANRLDDARAGLDYLKAQGFIVVSTEGPPVLRSASPEHLKAARRALRLSNQRLANEAGLSVSAVVKAQVGGGSVRRRTLEAILSALVRLGAQPIGGEP